MFSPASSAYRAIRSRFEGGLSETFKLFFTNPTGVAALGMILLYALIALLGPSLASYNPYTLNLPQRLTAPSSAHLMGTDDFGRDIWTRVIYAIRLDMELAFLSVTISFTIGVLLGILSGYMGKITDNAIMRVMDILFSFPAILLAIAISIAIGGGFWTIVVAVVVITVPAFARISRSVVLSTKNELYVTAAVSLGAKRGYIMLRHILPVTVSPSIVLYSLNLGGAIIVASSLSFLGIGINPPTPELGAMVYEGFTYVVSGQWWLTLLPGLFIVFIVVAFNMMGDTIREVTDVTLRR